MKLSSLFSVLATLVPLPAFAVSISIDAEVLKAADGSPMPQSGVVVLTAATNGSFHGPAGSSFATGDELFLASWDLSTWGTDGVFSGFIANLSFTGDWDQGDPLGLYWYPSLTLADAGPGTGIAYGFYTDSAGLDGSDIWKTPDESASLSLRFYTSDASFLPANPGTNDSDAGIASLIVPPGGISPTPAVPDAGGTLFLMSLGLAGLVTVRHFRLRSFNA
jgi:hypothetical protein